MQRNLPYNTLKEFYLTSNVYGLLGEFNKKFFPNDWEDMKKALEEHRRAITDGQSNS